MDQPTPPTPFFSPSRRPTPPSCSAPTASTPSATPSTGSAAPSALQSSTGMSAASAMWSGNGVEWGQDFQTRGYGGMMGTPLGVGHPPGLPRRPLGDMPANQMPALGLASPFVPSDPNAVWAPPGAMPSPETRSVSLEKELAAAQRRIRELSLENHHLKEREASRFRSVSTPTTAGLSPIVFNTPATSTSSSLYFDSVGSSLAYNGYTGMPIDHGVYTDDDSPSASPGRTESLVPYIPPQALQVALLRNVFDFAGMRDAEIRPVVWVIAHAQPHSSTESASLKAAVSHLANRFSFGNTHPSCIILVNAILEWARDLCFTSCGNYLCQQLLERADMVDKQKFIDVIKDEIVDIAGDKFGTHVLCKAIAIKELEEPIADALLKFGIFDSLKTGARRLWREYLERCRQNRVTGIFDKINEDMKGRWAELACANEHGSISVQQVFEIFGAQDLTDPCFDEILASISNVANSQFGHFLITKLLGYPHLNEATREAILGANPPVAITHHGVNFVKIALSETARPGLSKYIDSICASGDGQTPGIVSIATASVGKAHLIFVLAYLNPQEQNRIRTVCRSYSTTLRNSQSGNDLLRSLGIINAFGSRYRAGLS